MEDRGNSRSKVEEFFSSGEREIHSSFISANVECQNLGTFRVPKAFHNRFGRNLPSRLRFKCHKFVWSGKYDSERSSVYGLRSFMLYYGIRIFNIVQFDYYGEGMFTVKMYKETAIECHYPSSDPNQFRKSESAKSFREDQYLIEYDSLEYDKRIALLTFNGFRIDPDYVEIHIISMDIDPRSLGMILKRSLESFYKNWKHGSKISLRFVKQIWEIEIEWMAGRCILGKGWLDFAKDTNLVAGDSLILYKFTNDDNLLNVCIFKGEEFVNDNGGGAMIFPRSFYKVVSGVALSAGLICVPKLVKENYSEKLNLINKMEVAGVEWFVFFNPSNGFLKGLNKMMEFFTLKEKETVFFTMEEDCNIISARVYGEDGMEIDYLPRTLGNTESADTVWFWHIDWPSDSESEDSKEEEAVEAEGPGCENEMDPAVMNNHVVQFSATLSKCHVHNKTQGVCIPIFITPANRQWIGGERVLLRTDRGSWSIGLTVNNRRARFSAGWNCFAKDNKLKKRETLVFAMIEEGGEVVFDVTKFGT